MSQFLLFDMNKNKQTVPRDMQHNPIFQTSRPNPLQQDFRNNPFVPSFDVKPGTVPICDVNFESSDLIEEQFQHIKFDVSTLDAVNHPTFPNDALSVIGSINFELNGGNDRLIWESNDAIHMLFKDWILENTGFNIPVAMFLRQWRRELFTYLGVTVTDASPQTMYLPLAPFMPFLKDIPINGLLNAMRIRLGFRVVPTDAKDACLIARSNTTSAAYNSSIRFNNISFCRQYRIVRDRRTVLIPDLKTVLMPIPQFDISPFDMSWNVVGTDRKEIKLSELSRRKDIHHVDAYVRKNETAYNAASAGMKYSGAQFITYKIRELFGERRELDFTSTVADNAKKLQAHEIDTYVKRWGVYPASELIDQSINNLAKYYVPMTSVYFDDIKIEKGHNEVINTLNSDDNDYLLTFECAGAVGADCELVIVVYYYDKYMWNGNQLKKLS